MKAKDFDKKFDDNQSDLVSDLNLSASRRPNRKQKPVKDPKRKIATDRPKA